MPDDIAALFAPPPAGPAQDVRYRQGTVIAWDPLTASNVIDVGGTWLTDLPVLNTSEALLLGAGDSVGLLAASSERGAVSYVILGRLTVPNTPGAASALQALTNFISTATVASFSTTTSATFVDLSTYGPEVTAFIRGAGKALVFLGAKVFYDIPNDASDLLTRQPQMGFDCIGANTVAANGFQCLELLSSVATGPASNGVQATYVALLENLAPGETTFIAKYRSAVNTLSVGWSERNLTVIAL